ncbi:MAG: hypothetical protein ACLQGV_19685 [Bryobacteraceae bacterium]
MVLRELVVAGVLWWPATGGAQITDLTVQGVTPTQAIVSYTAPTEAACRVEVSESRGFSTLVHDVNSALFPGADLDSRTPALFRAAAPKPLPGHNVGRSRVFVAGKRALERGLDGRVYSRALQAATTHHVRVTCGTDQAQTQFQTLTVPFGDTFSEGPLPDPEHPGATLQPSIDLADRNTAVIDPQTGVLVKPMTLPQDSPTNWQTKPFVSMGLGANWSKASKILDGGGGKAAYNGASCLENCDWLLLASGPVTGVSTVEQTDFLRLALTGAGNDPASENRAVQACVSLDGARCDPLGLIRELVLPPRRGAVTAGTTVPGDTWRPPDVEPISTGDLKAAGAVRFLIRKKTSSGTISIDAATFDWGRSHVADTGSGGNFERCSAVRGDAGWYLCNSHTGGSVSRLYRVNGETGETRFLGLYPSIGGRICSQDNAVFDASVPTRAYCQATDGVHQLDYVGDGEDKPGGSVAEFSQRALALHIAQDVQTFVSRNALHYRVAFDAAKYFCGLRGSKNQYLVFYCNRGSQDSYGWTAVFDIRSRQVVAAMPSFASAVERWCGNHSYEESGHQNVQMATTQVLKGSGTGHGPYTVALTSAVSSAGQTTFEVAGEPTSPSADTYLQDAAIGDVFQIGAEYARILAKDGPTRWRVARGEFKTVPAVYPSGTSLTAICANHIGAGPAQFAGSFHPVWDFVGDPYGADSTGKYEWANRYVGHQTSRLNRQVNVNQVAETAEGQFLLATVKQPEFTIELSYAPRFAGKYAPGEPNTYQGHPTWHNVGDTREGRRYFIDARPFVGGSAISAQTPGCAPTAPPYPARGGCAASLVPGTANVYRYTLAGSANSDGINSKFFATFGVAGSRQLRSISGPASQISDATPFTFCEALVPGECRPDSARGDLFVSVPGVGRYYCTSEGHGGGSDICLSDFMAQGAAVTQFGAIPGAGPDYMRVLARHALGYHFRGLMSLMLSAKSLPNGKWILAQSLLAGHSEIALIKVPPLPRQSLKRNSFLPVQVVVDPKALPRGADNVVADFGYDSSFHCSANRAERCIATKSLIDEAVPYLYPTEAPRGDERAIQGLPCVSGCTLTIPAYSSRVVYYQVRYRDAKGNVLSAGPVQVRAVP